MSENLETKINKLLEYGKTQLHNKGITTEPTSIRETLDRIAEIETEPNVYATTIRINQNGVNTITPEGDADGFSEVEIITKVDVEPNLQNKSIEITENGVTTVVADDGYDGLSTVEVITSVAGSGSAENKLPDYVSGYLTEITKEDLAGATRITQYGLAYKPLLTKITLPSSITEIGDYGIAVNTKLTDVILNEGLTTTGAYITAGCTKLTNITIPSTLENWGTDAFANLSTINVTFTEGLTSIGSKAFYAQNKNTPITMNGFPASLKTIGGQAFYNRCFYQNITFPSTIESIGNSAFYVRTNSSSDRGPFSGYTIKIGAKNIGASAFQTYSYAKPQANVVFIEGVETIGNNAFRGGSTGVYAIQSSLPTTLKSIGSYAFAYATIYGRGSCFVIPDNVTSMDTNTFYNCPCNVNIVVGKGITDVPAYAFYMLGSSSSYASYPKGLYFLGDITNIAAYALYGATYDIVLPNCTSVPTLMTNNTYNINNIYVPENLLEDFKIATNWSAVADKIIAIAYDNYTDGTNSIRLGNNRMYTAILNGIESTGYYATTAYNSGIYLKNNDGVQIASGIFIDNVITITVDDIEYTLTLEA